MTTIDVAIADPCRYHETVDDLQHQLCLGIFERQWLIAYGRRSFRKKAIKSNRMSLRLSVPSK
jgi:hypothetical protein